MRIRISFLAACAALSAIAADPAGALVRIEFEGRVTNLNVDTLDPSVDVADVVTGRVDVDTSVAPADTDVFDPGEGVYASAPANPAPPEFIESFVEVGGVIYPSQLFSSQSNQTIHVKDVDDPFGDFYEVRERTLDLPGDAFPGSFRLDIDFFQNATEIVDMIDGDAILQAIDWEIEPTNTSPPTGFFEINDDTNSPGGQLGLEFTFGLVRLRITETAPEPHAFAAGAAAVAALLAAKRRR